MKCALGLLVTALVILAVCGAEAAGVRNVRCKSGLYCPCGMKCLADGTCGRSGRYRCWPGDVEIDGGCMPAGNTYCGRGRSCPPGEWCGPASCKGGIYHGPLCPGAKWRCRAGERCNPYTSLCYDPRGAKLCGHQLCNIHAACGENDECFHILGERVQQSTATTIQDLILPEVRLDLQRTLDRIARGEEDPHPNDGEVFKNYDRCLPAHSEDPKYYREYVHRIPGMDAEIQRIVKGKGGEFYWTPDHYKTFYRMGD
jgi:guanyl-specific ribonuclease Sa